MEYLPYQHLIDVRTGEDFFFIAYDKDDKKIMCETLEGKIYWIDEGFLLIKEEK